MTSPTQDKMEREACTHHLKCWPEFFLEISEGRKTHELRRCDDRDFRIGDRLCLNEYDPKAQAHTGRSLWVYVTYITDAESVCAFSPVALAPNFCILSIRKLVQLGAS